MKGLALSRRFFEAHGIALLEECSAQLPQRVAVGLVGPGSECWGYDDELSRDHDWGPCFCLWLMKEDFNTFGPSLQRLYEKLPKTFEGFGPRVASPGEEARVGVIEMVGFYAQYAGLPHVPLTTEEWLKLPEQGVAVCTNGEVFHDPLGEFTRRREALLAFYPEDVCRLKIASKCMTIAQAGQYNFGRSVKRGEWVAARYFETQFCAEVISLVYLLNRRFRPFYKWAHRAMSELPVAGAAIGRALADLARATDENNTVGRIEEISRQIIRELHGQGISDSTSDFLFDHAPVVHRGISSAALRRNYPLSRQ